MSGGTTKGIAESVSDVTGIKLGDSSSVDAFGRLRVGNPFPVFDNKNIFSKNQNQWEEDTNGVGASITHLPDEASVDLTIGTVSGEYAIRQTRRYHAYVPGKSQYTTLTGVFGAAKDNVVRRVGYFDDNDGLFFQLSGSVISVVRRTSTSGTPVDNVTEQSDWNIDTMDGSGVSGINIDLSKTQIFIIDFQWLGSGRVRFGFDINGQIFYFHHMMAANFFDSVYMATPTLPLRYEIRNIGISASATSLKEICCSVASEGGYTLSGFEFAVSTGAVTKAITTTRTPVLAIRLKNLAGSKENRVTARFLRAILYTSANDVLFEIAHLHDPTAITATWTDVGTGSFVEHAINADITSITGNPEHIIEQGFVPAGQGASAQASDVDSSFINLHSFLSQNKASDNSQAFVIYATSFTGTANAAAGISWLEFD